MGISICVEATRIHWIGRIPDINHMETSRTEVLGGVPSSDCVSKARVFVKKDVVTVVESIVVRCLGECSGSVYNR
jgi:hypothetical protein